MEAARARSEEPLADRRHPRAEGRHSPGLCSLRAGPPSWREGAQRRRTLQDPGCSEQVSSARCRCASPETATGSGSSARWPSAARLTTSTRVRPRMGRGHQRAPGEAARPTFRRVATSARRRALRRHRRRDHMKTGATQASHAGPSPWRNTGGCLAGQRWTRQRRDSGNPLFYKRVLLVSSVFPLF